jgi:HAD superfamily hydrolase (TIGR01450 family)
MLACSGRKEAFVLAERFDAFLFDLDGVVYLGDEALPHAKESLARLHKGGKEVRFLTNDPRPTREEVARKLAGMGVEAREGDVVTSGRATAGHLRKSGTRSAYVVGSPGLTSEIRRAGIEVAAAGCPEAVVVGADERTSYRHVRRAARLIAKGAKFVATNPDGSFPTPDGPSPGTGAIAAAVEAASGVRPTVIGKPHPSMFDAATEGLGPEARTVMLGDNPETDVLGAHRYGIAAVLVSAEALAFPSARDFRAPDATIPDLSSLFDPAVNPRRWERPPFPRPERVAAGVAAVVFDGSGRVLLGRRADNGLWGLPSGRVEPAETVEEAAVREVREETGLEVEVVRLIGVYSDPASQAFVYPMGEVVQFVTSCFRCGVVGGGLRADGRETTDAAFFAVDRLPADLLTMHPRWLSDALPRDEAVG